MSFLIRRCWSSESRIWKPCTRFASRQWMRSRRWAMPWKVPIHRRRRARRAGARRGRASRAAALLVKVTARMLCGRGALGLDHPGDAVREHARLAAAGAGQHQHRAERRGDRRALRVVQGIEDRGQIHGGRILRERVPVQAAAGGVSCEKRTRNTTKLSSTGPEHQPEDAEGGRPADRADEQHQRGHLAHGARRGPGAARCRPATASRSSR